MRTIDVITPPVRDELKGTNYSLWKSSLAAPNGSHYGIPFQARRVAKFNPVDKSFTEIGPDFGDGRKWERGAITDNGIIYCVSSDSNRGILKIDTNTDTALELDVNLLPERGDGSMWVSCAAALDGCIYFMPYGARLIMKLDPNNNDAMSSVGDDQGDGYNKYIGTIVGDDGYVYGIPYESQVILKYDPINGSTYLVGEICPEYFECIGNGALARYGYIYAVAGNGGLILQINTANNSWSLVGKISRFFCDGRGWIDEDWCDAVMGIDGCIYWPPVNARCILKYDPFMKETLVAGDDFGISKRWYGGCLATDGVIYCFPANANQGVLAIDPFGEFSETTKTNMKDDRPGKFGSIFEKVTFEADEDTYEEEDEDDDMDEEEDDDTDEEKHEDAHEKKNEDVHEKKNEDTDEEKNEDTQEEKNEDTHEEEDEDAHEEKNEDTLEEENEDTDEEKNEDTYEEKNEDTHEEKRCLTNFHIAVFKFGHNKVFEVLKKHLTPINNYCEESNLYPFMLVASQKESELYAIHQLLRRDLSWVNKCISSLELEGKSTTKRKRKYDHSL